MMGARKQAASSSISRNWNGCQGVKPVTTGFMAAVCFLLVVGIVPTVRAAETADELYEQGRFQEALDAYDRLDLENPKDLRYRYNRGCAAYRKGDHQRAMAAFSSLLRRLDTLGTSQAGRDRELRAKATFNMGNTAFQQGAYERAAQYYKQALEYEETRADARYNLELALRRLDEKQRQEGDENTAGAPPENREEDGGEANEGGDGAGESPPEETPEREQDKAVGEGDETRDAEGTEANEPAPVADEPAERGQREEEHESENLSGDLKGPQVGDSAPREGADEDVRAGVSAMDRERAEALLDNVIEDRARFLRFQIPEDKTDGVPSGKDW